MRIGDRAQPSTATTAFDPALQLRAHRTYRSQSNRSHRGTRASAFFGICKGVVSEPGYLWLLRNERVCGVAVPADQSRMTSKYAGSWRDLDHRERVYRYISLLFVPAVMITVLLACLSRGDVGAHFGVWVGGGGIFMWLAARIYRYRFRCPRCRQHFLPWRVDDHEEVQECNHCGLLRGALGAHPRGQHTSRPLKGPTK